MTKPNDSPVEASAKFASLFHEQLKPLSGLTDGRSFVWFYILSNGISAKNFKKYKSEAFTEEEYRKIEKVTGPYGKAFLLTIQASGLLDEAINEAWAQLGVLVPHSED